MNYYLIYLGIGLRTLVFHPWKHIAQTFKWSTKINIYKNFKYLGRVLTADGMWDTEIRSRVRIVKDAFQKLSKVLRSRIVLLKTRKRVLKCLCNVCLSLWQYILENFVTDEEKKTWSNRKVVIQRDTGNVMYWTWEQQWRRRENWNMKYT